ncbi:venom phosphodiesterase-like isoform X2 [Palaemon carinicauda]|uniref:venom phosphodiesterase-like isoform X2 n=1 Tax=Palaemon carinicauda TaxID=392227 RepID=UPI0035B59FED
MISIKTLICTALLRLGVATYLNVQQPLSLPANLNQEECPPSFKQPPLILVSMDGFRAEYLIRGLTPTIAALARKGVRAPYMKPSYPTITFPNHYTIATGLYPPAHGIVANKFFDPVFNTKFKASSKEFFKARWWGGEPIWKTAERQGKRAATFFWPGSEVEGNQASYWFIYNKTVPFEYRVDVVLSWLDLPPEQRPSFATLYMHEPDTVGHKYGPDSAQVDATLTRVDSMIKRLLDGIMARNLLSCVNLLIVADHGMAEAGPEKVIRLDKYIPGVSERTRFYDGVFGRMTPNDGSHATKKQMLEALACKRRELRVYEKTSLPIRWHMGTQRRVEDIVVDLDPGFTVAGNSLFEADAGDHGYDNFFSVMNAMFVAHGPSFLRNTEVEAFQNIELYNLMCHLLGVSPAPNNGTWGALHHLLSNPPPYPKSFVDEVPPAVGVLPSEDDLEDKFSDLHCEGDEDEAEELLELLEEAHENLPSVVREHLPWGLPAMGRLRDSVLLLPHPDTVTGYSSLVKMPLWTSYTLDAKPKQRSSYGKWRSDFRLPAQLSPSCHLYRSVSPYNVTGYPLFPTGFIGRRERAQLPFLTSNAVPFTNQLAKRWEQLLTYVEKWGSQYGTINVISGPVFDYDADTFADDLVPLGSSGALLVPTHVFMVVTRCLHMVDDLSKCPHNYLDAAAFVYPQYLTVTNCLSSSEFAREFSATVLDVEKITGLKFFTHLNYEDQVRLRVRIHSNLWGRESWWNRIRSDIFGLE